MQFFSAKPVMTWVNGSIKIFIHRIAWRVVFLDAHRSLELSIFLKNIVLFLNIRLVFLLHGFQDGLRFGNSNNIIIHYFDGFCEVLIYQLEILRCLGVCGLQEGGGCMLKFVVIMSLILGSSSVRTDDMICSESILLEEFSLMSSKLFAI